MDLKQRKLELINGKELFAIFAILLVSCAVFAITSDSKYFFSAKSYANAYEAQKAILGEANSAGIWGMLVSAMYSMSASLFGVTGFDPNLLLVTNASIAVGLGFGAGLFVYTACRSRFSQEASLLASILAVCAAPSLGVFLAGTALPTSLAIVVLAFSIVWLFWGLNKESSVRVLVGGLLAAASVLISNYAALGVGAILFGLVAQIVYDELMKKRNNSFLMCAAAFAVPAFVGIVYGLSAFGAMDFASEFVLLGVFVPVVLLAILTLAMKAIDKNIEENDALFFGYGLASIIAGAINPLMALPGLAMLTALVFDGLERTLARRAVGLVATAIFCAFIAYLVLSLFIVSSAAMFIGALIGVACAFVASLAGELKVLPLVFAALLMITSLSAAAILAQSQTAPINAEVINATKWIAANANPNAIVGVVGDNAVYSFISERNVSSAGIMDWLLGTENSSSLRARGIDYLLVDYEAFDVIEANSTTVRIGSFTFTGLVQDSSGNQYGRFVSQTGSYAYAPLNSQGTAFDTSGDAELVDSNGNMRTVPFARFVLIKDSEGRIIRAIYPYDNYQVNLFKLFFGTVDGMEKLYPSMDGGARVFQVAQ